MRNLLRPLFVIFGVSLTVALTAPAFGQDRTTEPPPPPPTPLELGPPASPHPAQAQNDDAATKVAPAPADEDVPAPAWLNQVQTTSVGSEEPGTGSAAPDRDESPAPETQAILATTQHGAMGLLRVLSANTPGAGRLVLQFTGQLSSGSGVIVRGDRNTNLGGALAVAYGLGANFELFGSFSGSSNKNRRVCAGSFCESEPGRVDPEVIRAFGDLVLGAKVAHQVDASARLALYGSVRLMSSTDNVFVDWGATSVALGGLGTWDLSQSQEWPIRFHANLGYFIDNSGNLQDFTGVGQPSQLVASYAYGLGRSRFKTAAAIEVVPQRLARDVFVSPFVEYHLQLTTGAAEPAFADFARPACRDTGRPCQDNRDAQWLSVGVRSQLPAQWSMTAAIDLGIRSVGFPYGTPQAPLTFAFQVGRPFDFGDQPRTLLSSDEPSTAQRPSSSERGAAKVEDGVVVGRVQTKAEGAPVSLAVVSIEGRAHAKVATDPDGTFTTHDLEPGVYDVTVSAPGFEPQTVRAKVAAGMATELDVALAPRIKTMAKGQVLDAAGKGVAAEVRFEGTSRGVAFSNATGAYEVDLAPGVYVVRVEAEGKLTKEQRLTLEPGQTVDVNFTLRPQREVAAVEWRGGSGSLVVRLPVSFQAQSGGVPVVISSASLQVLDEIVDLMVKQPRVRRLVIETHWDAAVGKVDALTVTQQQAQTISDYLQAQGVAADRLELAPRGASSPLVPGVGVTRTQNRRVVFTVIEG